MSNRLDRRFSILGEQGRKALAPFITAGDPSPEWTVPIMHALVKAGADLIELGVPFSDPTADGPVIQASSERAIGRGVNVHGILDMVRRFRESDQDTPVVLMSYLNPIERLGVSEFAEESGKCGVDGLLLVDCPPEEMGELRAHLNRHALHPICLVAPTTTPSRAQNIVNFAAGYLYYVSFKGITGASKLQASTIEEPISRLRELTDMPILVGFGIKDAESAMACARWCDGVVIGSALVAALEHVKSEGEAVTAAAAFLAPIRQAMDNTASSPVKQGQ